MGPAILEAIPVSELQPMSSQLRHAGSYARCIPYVAATRALSAVAGALGASRRRHRGGAGEAAGGCPAPPSSVAAPPLHLTELERWPCGAGLELSGQEVAENRPPRKAAIR